MASFKGFINFVSVILNVVFIWALMSGYLVINKGADSAEELPVVDIESNEDIVKRVIIEREVAELPLTIQAFNKVNDIKIDSIVLTQTSEPYAGYIVSRWIVEEKVDLSLNQYAANGYRDKFIEKERTVYVKVQDIRLYKDEVSWDAGWRSAYYDLKL